MSKFFRVGQYVQVAEDNDNEGYDSFRGKKLQITSKATNTQEHPGYDDSMEGMPLYDLKDATTGEAIDSSLYFYELQKWD